MLRTHALLLLCCAPFLAACRTELLSPSAISPDGAVAPADLARASDLAVAQVSCGGLVGIACAVDSYCDYPAGSACGGEDSAGVCARRPDACPDKNLDIVCGCDGQTYSRPCDAHLAGVSIAHGGACPVAPFACGAETCNAGSYCLQGCSGIGPSPQPRCSPIPPACLADPTCDCIVSPPGGGAAPNTSCETFSGGGVKVTYSGCD